MKKCGRGFLAARPRLHLAIRLQGVQRRPDRTSRARAEGKGRTVAEGEITGIRETHRPPRVSRDISTIRLFLPSRMHRIYRGESASRENGATQRSNMLHCSRLGPPMALIQVEGVVSDSATEVREQAKSAFHATSSKLLRPRLRSAARARAFTIARGMRQERIQGRPRPELIALATWDVFGRFSVQRDQRQHYSQLMG